MYGYTGFGTNALGSTTASENFIYGTASGSGSTALNAALTNIDYSLTNLGKATGVGSALCDANALFSFSFYASGSSSVEVDDDGINTSRILFFAAIVGVGTLSVNNASTTITRKMSPVRAIGSSTLSINDDEWVVSTNAHLAKKFHYKIYDNTGTYKTTLSEGLITTPVQIVEQINTLGSEVVVGIPLTYASQVGDIIDTGAQMDIYVSDSQQVNGVRVFSGAITKIEQSYSNEVLSMILLGFGNEFSQYIIESAGSTQVAFNSYEPADILRELLDMYIADGGHITYDIDSIEDTGTTVSYTFNANSLAEGIDKVLELAPEGWYYYIDQATNTFHFHHIGDEPEHTFTLGRDINGLTITKNNETIINKIYFLGGDGLYRLYTHAGSITDYGIRSYRYKDERVTLPDTADIIANRLMSPTPEINVELEVADNNNASDRGYDIESVGLGQMIKVGGTGSSPSSRYDSAIYDTSPYDYDLDNVSTVVFQVTNKQYDGNTLKMSLSTTPPDIAKRISDIKRNIDDINYSDAPTTPDIV